MQVIGNKVFFYQNIVIYNTGKVLDDKKDFRIMMIFLLIKKYRYLLNSSKMDNLMSLITTYNLHN